MAEYQVGDRVRVTYEGEVVRTDFPQDRYVQLAHMAGGCLYLPDTADVEVVERRKPKVGDTIEGEAAYQALPVGSVVARGKVRLFKTSPHWTSCFGSVLGHTDLADPRTLAYLPES